MGQIHPTAIIDPSARLHESVEVGPYSIIEAGVQIGEGTVISSSVRIYANAVIGKHNRIMHTVVINGEPQDLGFPPDGPRYTIIGDHNVLREDVNISGSEKADRPTRIGDHNYMMCDTHVGHDGQWGDHNVLVPGVVVGGHVSLGSYVVIGGATAVHQHCSIGDYSMIGGCSKITKDVPPYGMVEGNPGSVVGTNVVGLKRAGFTPDERKEIKDAFKTIYHSGKNIGEAVRSLADGLDERGPAVRRIVEFFQNSKRGVTDHR